MYKISPTLLDSFQSIREDLFDKPVEDLIEYIKGEREQTESMRFGSLIHEYFEKGDSELLPSEKEQLKGFYEANKIYPKEIYSRIELFPGIVFAFKVDQMVGNIPHEIKTGSKFWGVDLYDNSPQWKVYALCLNAPKVVYHYFQYYRSKNIGQPASFNNYSRFSFFSYEGMKDEIESLTNDFILFVKEQNLEQYILLK